jgi:hypothetical protein
VDHQDEILRDIQRRMRRRWDVLDAHPEISGDVYILSLIMDSTASQNSVRKAGIEFVRLMNERGHQKPSAIVVVDESQARQIAQASYIPSSGQISWTFYQ